MPKLSRLRVLLPSAHRFPRGFRPRSAVHFDHLDDQQARPMKDSTAAAQTPGRARTARISWNPCLLHHHDCLCPANLARVCHKTAARWAERRSESTLSGHRCISCHGGDKVHNLVRLHPCQNHSSPVTGTRYTPPRTCLFQSFLPPNELLRL